MNDWYGKTPVDVACDPTLSTTAKAVYAVLAVHVDVRTNQCYPSWATLQRATGKSRATVYRALRELVDAGVVTIEARFHKGQQTSNLYTLIPRGEGVTGETPRGFTSDTQN